MAGLVLDEHGHDDVSWSRKEAGGILPHPTKLLLLVLQWRCLRSIENTEFLPHPDRNVFCHKKSDRCMAVPGTMHVVEPGIIQGQVGPETSNNIIEKGLALRPKQSGSVV